ncbi:hypothetical protein ACHAP5_009380 [Fusarium lateritium]
MSPFKNIAVAGASGDLGSAVFSRLVASNKFNLTVLTRSGTKATFPEGIKVIEVDYDSLDSLIAALQGQDAVVSALAGLAIPSQDLLIDAAVAAGVKRFLPSEFGSNLVIPSVRNLPVFRTKVIIEDKLIALANEGKISYTFVFNSGFLDWGLDNGLYFDFAKSEFTIWDDGNVEFSTTTLASVGDAVIGVLSHPKETQDRVVYVQSTSLTLNKFLQLAKEVNPSKEWTVKHAKIDDVTAKSDANVAKGIFDWPTLSAYLIRSLFDAKSVAKFPKLDNELLGVKSVTDDEVKELLRPHVQ